MFFRCKDKMHKFAFNPKTDAKIEAKDYLIVTGAYDQIEKLKVLEEVSIWVCIEKKTARFNWNVISNKIVRFYVN